MEPFRCGQTAWLREYLKLRLVAAHLSVSFFGGTGTPLLAAFSNQKEQPKAVLAGSNLKKEQTHIKRQQATCQAPFKRQM